MFSKDKENENNKNDCPLNNLPPNFNLDNLINNPLKNNKQTIINSLNQQNSEKLVNNQIKSEPPKQNSNKKLIKIYSKKPSVNSILKTNNNAFDFDLKNLNDVNKKYTLFEDVALEKIYDDIQKDLKNNFPSDSLNNNNKINNKNAQEKANYPGIVYIKKKTNESNKQKNLVNNPIKISKEIEKNIISNKTPISNSKLNTNLNSTSTENIITNKPVLPISNNINFNNNINKKGIVKEEDLFLSMTKRLNFVEAQLKENKNILDKKTHENSDLQRKIEEMHNKLNEYEKAKYKNFNDFNYDQFSEEFENENFSANKNNISNPTTNSIESLSNNVYSRPKTATRIKSASSVNRSNNNNGDNGKYSNEDALGSDFSNGSHFCPNCSKLNKLIDDLYKFMNNLISFMHEQGFKFENMDYFKNLNHSRINEISNQLFPITEEENENTSNKPNTSTAKSSLPTFKIIKPNNENNPQKQKDKSSETLPNTSKLPKEIDIAVITRRIEELNMLIIKDNDHANFELDKSENVYKLKHRKEIKIGFFNNGIAIENFPFYEYQSKESLMILSDILDGYSPYIFKDKFPKGVLLQVLNKLNVAFDLNNNNAGGFGCNSTEGNGIQGLFDIKCAQKRKLSKDEFLSKLPNTILKDGKVYNIREDLSKIISGGKEHKTLNDLVFGHDGDKKDLMQNPDLQKELIDYSADRIEEIIIYNIDKIKQDFFYENKDRKNLKDYNSFLETLINEESELAVINNQICKFKITIPILNGKNLMLNVSKKKYVKEVFEELLDLIRKCSLLPKYKLMLDWSLVSIDKESFRLISTFPMKTFDYEDKLTLEENKLYPTSVFIFEEKKKV